MIRRLAFVGLVISSLWLVVPLSTGVFSSEINSTKLSQASFDLEKETLTRAEIQKAAPVKSFETSIIPTNSGENTAVAQVKIMTQRQAAIKDVVERQKDHSRKVRNVQAFLYKWSGPAKYYAEDFVTASELYDLDYRLLPSISIVESGACKHTFKPYNCFGWGKKTFGSYKESIFTVASGLSSRYVARGLDTPHEMGKIYAGGSTTWGPKVSELMGQMPK